MGHILTLEIPTDVYESLLKTAQQSGQLPENVAAQWLIAATRTLANDPVEQFIGAFSGENTSDWANQHDQHLGNSLRHRLSRRPAKGM